MAYIRKKDQSSKSHCAAQKPCTAHSPTFLSPRPQFPAHLMTPPRASPTPSPTRFPAQTPGGPREHTTCPPPPGKPEETSSPHAPTTVPKALGPEAAPRRLAHVPSRAQAVGDAEAGPRAPSPCPFREMTFHAGVQRKVINWTLEAEPASSHPAWSHKEPPPGQPGLCAPATLRGGEQLTLTRPPAPQKEAPYSPERRPAPQEREELGIHMSPVDRRASGRRSQAGVSAHEGPRPERITGSRVEACPGPMLSQACRTHQGTQPNPTHSPPTGCLPGALLPQHLRWLGRRPSGAFFCGCPGSPCPQPPGHRGVSGAPVCAFTHAHVCVPPRALSCAPGSPWALVPP